MPFWADLFKLFTWSFENDPLSQQRQSQDVSGAGVTQSDAIPDIRQDGSYWGGGKGLVRLRDTNDFIDLSSVSNRQSRYKEYERLRNVPEIEMAMTVLADEACLTGDTKVATVLDGLVPIKTLAKEKADQEFLVYCWDFAKNDYTLGWAFNPRLVKTAKTVQIVLDDGTSFRATADHRILMKDRTWKQAGELKFGDELTPFYRVNANTELTGLRHNQFPRVFTHQDGWKHERQFIDEWRTGRKNPELERVNRACRLLSMGSSVRECANIMGHQWKSIESWIRNAGFSVAECKKLGQLADHRRVIGVRDGGVAEVYDLSVKDHENFAGESCIYHNCQKGENQHVFEITCKNEEVAKELNHLFFHRDMLNYDRRAWNDNKNLFIAGDLFYEVIIDPDNPKLGVLKVQVLPPESMYRIETTKGRLVEFQQAKEGPDYDSLTRAPITQATDAEIQQAKAIRFHPEQIVHIKIGDDRRTFYPYGQSLIEPARGPAHQLRLMEDAMVVYRLTRAPERRVFYIDTAQLPPYKAEAFMERMKDQFKKKKVPSRTGSGASGVEERWSAPAADEDYWLPIRPNSNTRIETLPGAQNLGEIDDAVYFRNKLFTALNFPPNYFMNTDVQATRIALSAQDVKFARMVERLQAHIEDGLVEIALRHLRLRGFPEEAFEDLQIKMTPPSDWRELSRAEVMTNRYNNATALKGSMLWSDYDIYTKILKLGKKEAEEMLSRATIQKLQDLKLNVLAQNPTLLGIGAPSNGEPEMGTEPGGPNPMLGPDGNPPPDQGDGQGTPPPDQGGESFHKDAPAPTGGGNGVPLPEPTADDLKRYDLQVQTYSVEMDREEPDYSERG